MNSGAEAVETAIKTARKWGYKVKGIPENKAEIIVCANNFHGRTVTIISSRPMSTSRRLGPFTLIQGHTLGDIEALRQAIHPNTRVPGKPVQGEAGS